MYVAATLIFISNLFKIAQLLGKFSYLNLILGAFDYLF